MKPTRTASTFLLAAVLLGLLASFIVDLQGRCQRLDHRVFILEKALLSRGVIDKLGD